MNPVLEVSHLRKCYGTHLAVADISFTLCAGEVLGLLGPNGAGKSTTMMMLAGLLSPDGGEISLLGQRFRPESPDQRRLLGVVPQDLAIYPDLTAAENLLFFGRLYGLRGSALDDRVDEVLAEIGLDTNANEPARTFSGGMKRRLNFGVATLHRPQILILDEPTVGVDPQSRSHLLDAVRRLAARQTAVIYASHYMEEVQAICQRVAIVDHGRMLACDTISKLLDGMAADVVLHLSDPHLATTVLNGLVEPRQLSDGTAVVVIRNPGPGLATSMQQILSKLQQAGISLVRVETQETNLERLFLQLTGSSLRDG